VAPHVRGDTDQEVKHHQSEGAIVVKTLVERGSFPSRAKVRTDGIAAPADNLSRPKKLNETMACNRRIVAGCNEDM